MNRLNDPTRFDKDTTTSERFDVAFVGAGLSSTWTLISYLDQLRTQDPSSLSRIVIIEKSADMFKGIAYGGRSSDSTLIINCLGDFLPPDELSSFVEWIKSNLDWLFDRFQACDSDYTRTWLELHASKIVSNDLKLLYIPRYIFGLYLKHQADRALAECEQLGLIRSTKLQAKILDIKTDSEGLQLHARHSCGRNTLIKSSTVVLGLGSAPGRALFCSTSDRPSSGALIDDPFEPGMNDMLSRVYNHLDHTAVEKNKLIVIGSNASAADVVCNLVNYKDCSRVINKIHIMSPSGALPRRFSEADTDGLNYQPIHLLNLHHQIHIGAEDIYNAVKLDVSLAQTGNIPLAITFPVISQQVGRLIKHLSTAELQVFVAKTGTAVGKLQRRAGDDYSNVLDSLLNKKRLQVMKGRYLRYNKQKDNSLSVEYQDDTGNIREMRDITSIINCSGAGVISSECTDGLLKNLVERKICEVNDSGMGFTLTDNLEATQRGVFVVGPMIAGNVIDEKPVWHVEHCGRIMHFAAKLGHHLANNNTTSMLNSRQPTDNNQASVNFTPISG